jgi:HEPN domain-containing protein
MNEPRETLARQWVNRAESDLLNVANNINAQQVPWDTVCFHCQQAVEKYIKAVLVILDQAIPRIHDLVKVELPELTTDREDLRWLTTCAVGSRYPVEVMDAPQGEEDGHQAQAIARRMRESCRNYLKSTDSGLLKKPRDPSDIPP